MHTEHYTPNNDLALIFWGCRTVLSELLAEILSLSGDYSRIANDAMKRRQQLLKEAVPVLRAWLDDLAAGTSLASLRLDVDCGGQQGNVGPVPWARIFSKEHSPHTTSGFYLVYLFSADGSVAYLSLNQGTSDYRSGQWRPINDSGELLTRAAHASALLSGWESPILRTGGRTIDLKSAKAPVQAYSRARIRNYEDANVIATPYYLGEIPDDSLLRDDLAAYLPLLYELYQPGEWKSSDVPDDSLLREALPAYLPRANELYHPGSDTPPATGQKRDRAPGRGQGRRLDTADRKAVEILAMTRAKEYFDTLGWTVEDVSLRRPYDLDCTRASEVVHVEVKGTTSAGGEVILTPGEVKHAKQNPYTALFVLSEITLQREPSGTVVANGGKAIVLDPWTLDERALEPSQYVYRVGAVR